MYDTVQISDYIANQDAIEYVCKTSPKAILELEYMGLPFFPSRRLSNLSTPIR